MKNLIVVESPTKVKTIKKFINEKDDVISTKGHIIDLTKGYGKDWLGVRIEENFKPIYQVIKDKKEIVKDIKKRAKQAEMVLLATDPDREGEAIAYNVKTQIDENKEKVKRIRFNEITKNAILKAIEKPGEIDEKLVQAQQARRVLDRLIGFKLSSLLKSKIHSRSAGRVQSVALKLIVDKEKERDSFKPIKYFSFDIELECGLKLSYFGKDSKKTLLENERIKDDLVKEIKVKGVHLEVIEKSTQVQKKPSPLKTSTLIQKAATTYGYSAAKTMLIAQQLYEGVNVDGQTIGLITYMRTDSIDLSDEFKTFARNYLNKEGHTIRIEKNVKRKGFKQGAHEGIRPTNISYYPKKIHSLSPDQKKIYELIWFNAVSSFLDNALILKEKFIFTVLGHKFIGDLRKLKNEGYLKLYKHFKYPENVYDENDPLVEKVKKLKEKNNYKASKINVEEKETKPPKRYSIASLVKKLDEIGVGRPSTYSIIIKTLKSRFYITEENKSFIPTVQGKITIDALKEHFKNVVSETYTASIEKKFDSIAEGKDTYLNVIEEFYKEFSKALEKAEVKMGKLPPKEVGERCPKCGKPLVERLGRFGPFIGCSNYPECKYIKRKETIKVGRKCPKCNDGELVKRNSRRGTFIGCSNYPSCRYVEKEDR